MALPDESGYEIGYSKEEELPLLEQWLKEEESRRWYPLSTDCDVEMMAKNWIGFAKYGSSLTATYQGEVAGIATLFLMPYRKVIHHCLLYLIVNPKLRRQGVGRSLIKNATHLGRTYFRFDWINVELFEGCPALPLFEEAGYYEVASQERFVKEGEGRYLARHLYQSDFKEFKDGK